MYADQTRVEIHPTWIRCIWSRKIQYNKLSGQDCGRAVKGLLMDEALPNYYFINSNDGAHHGGNQTIPVKVTELLYQLSQACKDSQTNRDTGEVMDQLNTEMEAIMPLIQKYKEEGRSQSPNFCVWDSFLFSIMLLVKKIIAVLHMGNWEAF